nr:MAG TPA: restriction alleviation protein [Caudoviricetes sp.]
MLSLRCCPCCGSSASTAPRSIHATLSRYPAVGV